jgi:hypothetical protein
MSPAQSRYRGPSAVVAPRKTAGVLLALTVSLRSLERLCLPASFRVGGWKAILRGSEKEVRSSKGSLMGFVFSSVFVLHQWSSNDF